MPKRKKPQWERNDTDQSRYMSWILQFGKPNKWIEIEKRAPNKYVVMTSDRLLGPFVTDIHTARSLADAKRYAFTWIGADKWVSGETNPAKRKMQKIKCPRCLGTGKSKKQFEKIKGKLIPMTCAVCAGNKWVPKWENLAKRSTMTRSEAKRKVESLQNKILDKHGSSVWFSIISNKGRVDFVAVNNIEDGNIEATKRTIRAWAKKHKVDLEWLAKNPAKKPKRRKPANKKRTTKRAKKRPQIPPPFKRLTKKKINKLKGIFRVHDDAIMNPDPGDCPNCGMQYKDLKTGLDFGAVRDMLWIQDSNPEFWRHKGRGSVLGLWFEIKRGMWADHQAMCGGKAITEAEYLEYLDDLDEY